MRPGGTRRHPGQIPLGTHRDSRIMREEFRGTLLEGADPATPAPRRLPRSSPDNDRWDMVGDPPLPVPWPHGSIPDRHTPKRPTGRHEVGRTGLPAHGVSRSCLLGHGQGRPVGGREDRQEHGTRTALASAAQPSSEAVRNKARRSRPAVHFSVIPAFDIPSAMTLWHVASSSFFNADTALAFAPSSAFLASPVRFGAL